MPPPKRISPVDAGNGKQGSDCPGASTRVDATFLGSPPFLVPHLQGFALRQTVRPRPSMSSPGFIAPP